MLTFEDFIKAYQEAPPELKAFIDSGEIGDFCIELLKDSGFEDQKKSLVLLFSSYFLRKESASDLIAELSQTQLSNDFIINHIDKIKEFIERDISAIKYDSIESEIAETEAVLNAINLNGTLSEPTYTSTQEAILQEGRNTPSAS